MEAISAESSAPFHEFSIYKMQNACNCDPWCCEDRATKESLYMDTLMEPSL